MLKKSLYVTLFSLVFIQPNIAFSSCEIVDNVALQSFANQNLVKPAINNEIIEDEAVKKELKNIISTKLKTNNCVIEDTFIAQDINLKRTSKPVFKLKIIDENSDIIRVTVSSIAEINAKKRIKEGQNVSFKVIKDVYKNDRIFIKKGTPVDAFIETLTPSSRGGDPAEISIGRFTSIDIKGNKIDLTGEIHKQGANRAIWVRPLTDIVSNIPVYGAPFMLFIFIKGGDAKIYKHHQFILCYE